MTFDRLTTIAWGREQPSPDAFSHLSEEKFLDPVCQRNKTFARLGFDLVTLMDPCAISASSIYFICKQR